MFNNRIRLYWNVKLNRLESQNFNDAVVSFFNEFDMDPGIRDYIEGNDGSLNNNRIKQLTSWCLYGARVRHQEHETSTIDDTADG